MKNPISLLFVSVLFLIVPVSRAQTPPKAPWALYTIKDERISIALPVVPTLHIYKETRTPPQKDRKRKFISCYVKGVVYTVHLIDNTEPRLTLETFIQEQVAARPSENLTFERDLTVDGIAGKGFLYPDKKGMVQFFVNDNRLYEIRASGAPVDDLSIKTFFHHLSLRKQDGAIEVSDAVQSGSFDRTAEPIFSSKEMDTIARLISKPEPQYTAKARDEQITGTVVLKCIFAGNGKVVNIRVVKGLPGGLTEASIEAARKIKFKPGMKDGNPVSMWIQLEYNFNLYP